jgi:CRISPR-associated endonuclease/helicase Cas3
MCAAHRREVLAEIRADLKDGRSCRVVSTTLIEAGVDVDFPLVYRAEAGLDSIAQAAGRCNREGKRDRHESRTIVFEVENKARVLKSLRMSADAGRRIVKDLGEESLTPDAIEDYFRELYWSMGEKAFTGDDGLDRPGIIHACNKRARSFDLPFETITRNFRMVEDVLVPVIVPFVPREHPPGTETVHQLVDTLSRLGAAPNAVPVGWLARRLQPYTVGVPEQARATLLQAGAAEAVGRKHFGEQFVWLMNPELYKREIGLDWSDPTFRAAESLIS